MKNNDSSGTRHSATRQRQTFEHQTRRSTAHLLKLSIVGTRWRAEGKTKTETDRKPVYRRHAAAGSGSTGQDSQTADVV